MFFVCNKPEVKCMQQLLPHTTLQQITLLSDVHKPRLHVIRQMYFNWNIAVTSYKQGKVVFWLRKQLN